MYRPMTGALDVQSEGESIFGLNQFRMTDGGEKFKDVFLFFMLPSVK